jgi:hypothetical protein
VGAGRGGGGGGSVRGFGEGGVGGPCGLLMTLEPIGPLALILCTVSGTSNTKAVSKGSSVAPAASTAASLTAKAGSNSRRTIS